MQQIPTITGRKIRRIVLDESKRANVGHIGSALSVADILAALYGGALAIDSPSDPDRDRFVLSKGHAALGLYAALYLRGWLTRAQVAEFCTNGTAIGVHPENVVNGVDFSSGSLGLGLSFGAGAALAARLQRSRRRAYVLVSDAECDEGSIWEAIMFAAHHRLGNLVAIVDLNGQQALGYTHEVLSHGSLADRWRAFDWDVHEVDGHDVAGLVRIIADIDLQRDRPHVIIARTTFGHGVSFMESLIKWHYLPMSDAEYQLAVAEVEAES